VRGSAVEVAFGGVPIKRRAVDLSALSRA
jgi:hypothetical protein